MATFFANEINTKEEDIAGPTAHIKIIFSLKDNILQGACLKTFFLGIMQGRVAPLALGLIRTQSTTLPSTRLK